MERPAAIASDSHSSKFSSGATVDGRGGLDEGLLHNAGMAWPDHSGSNSVRIPSHSTAILLSTAEGSAARVFRKDVPLFPVLSLGATSDCTPLFPVPSLCTTMACESALSADPFLSACDELGLARAFFIDLFTRCD